MDRRKDARKGCSSFRSWRPIRGRVSRWSSQWEGVRHTNCEPYVHAHARFLVHSFITAMRQGKQTFANGNSYDGQFLQVFAGVCLFVCIVSTFDVSGIVYTFNHTRAHTHTHAHIHAHTFQGQIHGRGTYSCSDGRVYTGEFLNNKKHGQGRYAGTNYRSVVIVKY